MSNAGLVSDPWPAMNRTSPVTMTSPAPEMCVGRRDSCAQVDVMQPKTNSKEHATFDICPLSLIPEFSLPRIASLMRQEDVSRITHHAPTYFAWTHYGRTHSGRTHQKPDASRPVGRRGVLVST